MLDRHLMLQLRRICREPPHLNHLSHSDFLQQFRVPDPLLKLRHQLHLAELRDSQRELDLAPDDILRIIDKPDQQSLLQVLENVYEQQRGQAQWLQVPHGEHQCMICHRLFASLAILRRHQTVEHEHQPGLLRCLRPTDVNHGVPTCQRCGAMFSTWFGLKHHVQFVCTHSLQVDNDVEHRLRVQEYLHLVRGYNLAALSQKPEVCVHFQQRCILCGRFVTSQKGMLQHWNDDHTSSFQAHGPWYDYLHQLLPQQTPCMLCGTNFKREHRCLVLRQYALYLASTGEIVPMPNVMTQHTFSCQQCCKVFTTKHGLQQHLRNHHKALQDGTLLSNAQFDAHCLTMQAAESGAIAEILFDGNVKELLSQQCLVCQKGFSRAQDLMRHLRTQHADFWNQCTHDAAILERQWKKPNECYCHPFKYNRKHQCLLFLQYALLRITMGHAPDADDARMAQPDMLLTAREVVQQLGWLGLIPLILHKSSLKLHLSHRCQICDEQCSCPTMLSGHLQQHHAQDLQDIEGLTKLVAWTLFAEHGCVCNPAVHHSTPAHFCPMQTQIAYLLHTSGHKVIVPWAFRTTELLDIFETMLPGPTLQKTASLFISRQFEQILLSPDVYRLLTQRCIWCAEAVTLKQAMAHLKVCHHYDINMLKEITRQLAAVAAQDHRGFWCSYCGELLPSGEIDDDIAPLPAAHMPECAYVKLVSLMISFPVWHKKPFQADLWPALHEVERASQQMQRSLMQFNVDPSAPVDTLGSSYESMAESGLVLLSDPPFLQAAKYRCLMCQRCFYTPWKFVQHLYTHNFRQMDTHLCLHRLHKRVKDPCPFCDASKHLPQLAGICPTLFNVTIFLTNGSSTTPGRGQRYLEGNLDPRTTGATEASHQGRAAQQKAQAKQGQQGQQTLQAVIRRSLGNGGQTCPENRIESQCLATGASVYPAHQPGPWQHLGHHDGGHPEVASVGQDPAAETQSGSPHDGDASHQSGNTAAVRSELSSQTRSTENAVDHRDRSHAVPEMGPIESNAEADYRGDTQHGRDSSRDPKSMQTCPRPYDHTEVPQPHQNKGPAGQSSSLAVDAELSQSAGGLGRTAQAVLSRHLAAHSLPNTTSSSRSLGIGQDHPTDSVTWIVRILLNNKNLCYANSFVISLAWVAILLGGIDKSSWPFGGFELFRSLTMSSGIPVNLASFQPFLWLITSSMGWTIEDLDVQNDVAEFGHWMLGRTRPRFVSCQWVALLLKQGHIEAQNGTEKGNQHGPILLPIAILAQQTCSLQTFIDFWHDGLGVCRAAEEVRGAKLIHISRFLPDTGLKQTQCIEFSTTVRFPCYTTAEHIHFFEFEICAIVYHIGATPISGHYRAALRCGQRWLVYDDGVLPESMDNLHEQIHSNVVLIWLIPTADTARTGEELELQRMEQADTHMLSPR